MWAQLTNAPYSATQISQNVRTLADGTHITQPEQKQVQYRDSQGRTRIEISPQWPENGVNLPNQPYFIHITDPVAGFRQIGRHPLRELALA